MQQTKQISNGWDLEQFKQTIETVRDTPEAGKLRFRARFDWDGHFAGDGRTEGIEQMGEIIPRGFTLRGDHPPELLGENSGPTAVETLLCALGGCVGGTYAAHATAKGIDIERLEVELDGGIDLSGFLRLSNIDPGLDVVRLKVRVKSDATEEQLRDLLDVTRSASPVFDSLSRPVRIEPIIERMD
ncbi:MAG: OsmC family protein [Acidobacteria bacterium]|nr:OsmC family protein [Acidobacteriota bacterium]